MRSLHCKAREIDFDDQNLKLDARSGVTIGLSYSVVDPILNLVAPKVAWSGRRTLGRLTIREIDDENDALRSN